MRFAMQKLSQRLVQLHPGLTLRSICSPDGEKAGLMATIRPRAHITESPKSPNRESPSESQNCSQTRNCCHRTELVDRSPAPSWPPVGPLPAFFSGCILLNRRGLDMGKVRVRPSTRHPKITQDISGQVKISPHIFLYLEMSFQIQGY